MATITCATIDLGAASGRVMAAHFDGRRIMLDEVHRFSNHPVAIGTQLHWNIAGIWEQILSGLSMVKAQASILGSIGIDSWAVDYGLLDTNATLLGLPHAYRSHRTDGIMERVTNQIGRDTIFQETGIQFLPFNTLYQLIAHQEHQPAQMSIAIRLLMMPDLLHFWLSGEAVVERTNVSTTQCWNPRTLGWANDTLAAVGLTPALFPPIVEPGTPIGTLTGNMAERFGPVPIIVPATHDTASAIAAIPVSHVETWGYISSGTWSLVGMELAHPLMTPDALAANFTNEGGVFGTTRFLKNVMGLWLLQEVQRTWAERGQYPTIEVLIAEAEAAPMNGPLVNPDHRMVLAPVSMEEAIYRYLQSTNQPLPSTRGALVRTILESLAARSALVMREALALTGRTLDVVHVVGGGARNHLLNQWIADALGVLVLAGPVEATALGNAALQLVGGGGIATLDQVRDVVRASVSLSQYEPQSDARSYWSDRLSALAALP